MVHQEFCTKGRLEGFFGADELKRTTRLVSQPSAFHRNVVIASHSHQCLDQWFLTRDILKTQTHTYNHTYTHAQTYRDPFHPNFLSTGGLDSVDLE